MVEIGKTLGIEVVAEGVETMAHARILERIGCDKLQGDAFGPVLSPADLETYVSRQVLARGFLGRRPAVHLGNIGVVSYVQEWNRFPPAILCFTNLNRMGRTPRR